jgi:hypothetical protein
LSRKTTLYDVDRWKWQEDRPQFILRDLETVGVLPNVTAPSGAFLRRNLLKMRRLARALCIKKHRAVARLSGMAKTGARKTCD